jgi:multicomponent Na+:H+ antiporter subunit F
MLGIAITVSYALMSLALVLAFLRLAKGPSLPDRVVALELLASLTVGFIAVSVVSSGRAPFLDVAMVIALTAFLAAVGFARYLEKGAHDVDH